MCAYSIMHCFCSEAADGDATVGGAVSLVTHGHSETSYSLHETAKNLWLLCILARLTGLSTKL